MTVLYAVHGNDGGSTSMTVTVSFVSLGIRRCNSRFLPLLGRCFLIPNNIDIFRDLRTQCLISCLSPCSDVQWLSESALSYKPIILYNQTNLITAKKKDEENYSHCIWRYKIEIFLNWNAIMLLKIFKIFFYSFIVSNKLIISNVLFRRRHVNYCAYGHIRNYPLVMKLNF